MGSATIATEKTPFQRSPAELSSAKEHPRGLRQFSIRPGKGKQPLCTPGDTFRVLCPPSSAFRQPAALLWAQWHSEPKANPQSFHLLRRPLVNRNIERRRAHPKR